MNSKLVIPGWDESAWPGIHTSQRRGYGFQAHPLRGRPERPLLSRLLLRHILGESIPQADGAVEHGLTRL